VRSLGFAFLLFFILHCTEFTLSGWVKYSALDQTGKINVIMNDKVDPEIVIFGMSTAEVGLSSKVIGDSTGRSCYNAAIDGTPMPASKFVIDHFVRESNTCNTAILALSYFSLAECDYLVEPSRFLAYYRDPDVKRTVRNIDPTLYRKWYYVPFYSFITSKHTYYKNAALGAMRKFNGVELYPDEQMGFVPHNDSYTNTRKDSSIYELGVSRKSIRELGQTIEQLKSAGITPVVVLCPMYRVGMDAYSNVREYRETINELCATHQVPLLVDYSDHEIVDDESCFYNNGHFNAKGAQLFSEMVASDLNSLW